MLDIPCVRCSKSFERPNHPMAHFSSICYECRDISPETTFDQHLYEIKVHQKLMENK